MGTTPRQLMNHSWHGINQLKSVLCPPPDNSQTREGVHSSTTIHQSNCCTIALSCRWPHRRQPNYTYQLEQQQQQQSNTSSTLSGMRERMQGLSLEYTRYCAYVGDGWSGEIKVFHIRWRWWWWWWFNRDRNVLVMCAIVTKERKWSPSLHVIVEIRIIILNW